MAELFGMKGCVDGRNVPGVAERAKGSGGAGLNLTKRVSALGRSSESLLKYGVCS